MAQLVGCAGYPTAVVAVGGGEEGGLTEVPAEIRTGQVVVAQLRHILAQLPGDIPGHGEGAAQNLEGIETEAVALVLDTQGAQSQPGGHAVQFG